MHVSQGSQNQQLEFNKCFYNNKFIFICDYVYVVKKDVNLCGPLIKEGWVEEQEKVDETTASNFPFSSCSWGKWGANGRRSLPAVQLHEYLGMGDGHPVSSQGP